MGQKLSRVPEVIRNKIPRSSDCQHGGRGDRGMGFEEEEKEDDECEREEEDRRESRVNPKIENSGLYIYIILTLA